MATDVCISKQWSQSSNFFFSGFLVCATDTGPHFFSPLVHILWGSDYPSQRYGKSLWQMLGKEVIMICNDDGTIQIDMARQKQIINYEDCKKIFLVYTEHGTGILVHLQWFLRQRKSAQDV